MNTELTVITAEDIATEIENSQKECQSNLDYILNSEDVDVNDFDRESITEMMREIWNNNSELFEKIDSVTLEIEEGYEDQYELENSDTDAVRVLRDHYNDAQNECIDSIVISIQDAQAEMEAGEVLEF